MSAVEDGRTEPRPGIWVHHKGGRHRVLGTVRNATNAAGYAWMVQYVSLTYGEVFVRDLDEFLELVTVDGTKVPRFRYEGPAGLAPEKAAETP